MNEQALSTLHMNLLARNVTDDPATMAERIASAIPPQVRANYPADAAEAALAYFDVYYGGAAAAPAGVNPAAVQAPVMTAQPSTMTTQEKTVLTNFIKEGAEEKARRTAATRMDKVLFDKPLASTYVDVLPTHVIPVCTKAKLDEYRAKLVQTEENLAAFEEIAAACDTENTGDGTPMPIHIADTYKTIGYTISTPAEGTGNETMETKHMSTKVLIGFLASKLSGLIPAGPDELGCKLKLNTGSKRAKGQKSDVNVKKVTPRLYVQGVKQAKEDAAKHDFVSMVGNETKAGRLRIAKTFQIVTGKKEDGSDIVRNIRLSGKAQVPVFVRKNEEYNKAFPIAQKQAGIALPTGKQMAEMQETQANVMAFIMHQGNDSYDYALESVVEKISNDVNKMAAVGAVDL